MADYNADRLGYVWCPRCHHKHMGPCPKKAESEMENKTSNFKMTHSVSFNIPGGTGMSMGDLRELTKLLIPDDAKVNFTKIAGDAREPGYTSVDIRWTA